jgi:poly-gamma-glutamate synthesis protein (capsule biosynthesis protein)
MALIIYCVSVSIYLFNSSITNFKKLVLAIFIQTLILIGVVFVFTQDTIPTFIAPLVIEKYPRVLNFGDVMFDRGVRNIIEKRERDPFEYIKKDKEIIQTYDVVIANLEGPIIETDRSLCQQKAYNFQFASDTPARLKSVGITMVNIANNHSNDCLHAGYVSTRKYLDEAGIPYIGDKNLDTSFVVKEIDGKKIAFVGIDATVEPIPIKDFYPLIKKLKSEYDYVVVNIHWGTEYLLTADKNQTYIAHALVDNGADVIFGHHPHVIEPVEVYKGKTIFYSLGNFVFDQIGVEETRGLGVGVEFRSGTNVFALFPYQIKSFAPDFLTGDEKELFCSVFLKNIVHNGCEFDN